MNTANYSDPTGQDITCAPVVFAQIWVLYFLCGKYGWGFKREELEGETMYSAVYAPTYERPAISIHEGGLGWTWCGEQSAPDMPSMAVGRADNPRWLIAAAKKAAFDSGYMREVVVMKCDLDYNPSDSNWAIVREDDDRFAALAEKYPNDVRMVEDIDVYGTSKSYDANGRGV